MIGKSRVGPLVALFWSFPLIGKFTIIALIVNLLNLARGLLLRKRVQVYHTSINQSTNQSTNQSINQSKPVTTPGGKVIHAVLNDEKFNQSINQSIQPTPWLWEGHLQTMFTVLAPRFLLATPFVEYEREVLSTKALERKISQSINHSGQLATKLYDGEVALDWLIKGASYSEGVANGYSNKWDAKLPIKPYAYTEDQPILILCHGLSGGSSEHYIKAAAYAAAERCYRCVVINQRGCGRHPLTTPQTYTAGYTEDLRQAIQSINQRFPTARLSLVGFSLGANLVSKYAGEEGDDSVLSCVVSAANPWELTVSSNTLEHSFSGYWFSRALAFNLKSMFSRYRPVLETDPQSRVDWNGVTNAKTIRDFDQHLLAKIFGYESANHYYRDNSSAHFLTRIRSPFLSINALDDPICTAHAVPLEESQLNDSALIVLSHFGGHSLDSYTGWKPQSWAIPFFLDFVDAVQRHTPVKPSIKLN